MLKFIFLSSLFICLTFLYSCSDEPELSEDEMALEDGVTKILFIGNSLTFYNDMPKMVETMMNNQGKDSTYVLNVAWGGYSLSKHTREDFTLRTFDKQHWDWVVFQESSVLMAFPESLSENTLPAAAFLDSLIYMNNSATKKLVYMANSFKYGINDCETYPTLCSHDLMVDEVRKSYNILAEALDADVAPAAVSWKYIKTNTEIDLHDEDLTHPNAKGSLLSAMAISASISNRAIPVIPDFNDIVTEQELNLFIKTTNDFLIKKNQDWREY